LYLIAETELLVTGIDEFPPAKIYVKYMVAAVGFCVLSMQLFSL